MRHSVYIVTGSISCGARRRYLSYSEADFEVYRPARATRCTDGGEIWHGGMTPNFTSIGATIRYRTPKLKFFFTEI